MDIDSINEKSFSGGSYESPEISIFEMSPEGILCQSGQFEEWQEETL